MQDSFDLQNMYEDKINWKNVCYQKNAMIAERCDRNIYLKLFDYIFI